MGGQAPPASLYQPLLQVRRGTPLTTAAWTDLRKGTRTGHRCSLPSRKEPTKPPARPQHPAGRLLPDQGRLRGRRRHSSLGAEWSPCHNAEMGAEARSQAATLRPLQASRIPQAQEGAVATKEGQGRKTGGQGARRKGPKPRRPPKGENWPGQETPTWSLQRVTGLCLISSG